jgi:hypothetical protein
MYKVYPPGICLAGRAFCVNNGDGHDFDDEDEGH